MTALEQARRTVKRFLRRKNLTDAARARLTGLLIALADELRAG